MRNMVVFAAFLFIFGSCTRQLSPFTQDIYEENRLTEDDLRQIQFYLSQDLILKRQINDNHPEIINGQIKIENGRKIEQVVIRRGTPGVFLFSPKRDRLAVSFEDGGDKKYLMFGPNPKAGNRYVLLATDWEKRQGKVQYDGKFFWVSSDNAYAGLMVDLKRAGTIRVRTRTADGRTVD